MFAHIKNNNEVTKGLHGIYKSQVERAGCRLILIVFGGAGPVLGYLWVAAYIDKNPLPTAPHSVMAHLGDMRFGYWQDLPKYLRSCRPWGTQQVGERIYDVLSQRIVEMCRNPEKLLALEVPLLISSQLFVTSLGPPTPPKTMLMELLTPVVEAYPNLSLFSGSNLGQLNKSEHNFTGVLAVGRRFMNLTCDSEMSVRRWGPTAHQEATFRLLPQIFVKAATMLSPSQRDFMATAVRDVLHTWRLPISPSEAKSREYPWLPNLLEGLLP